MAKPTLMTPEEIDARSKESRRVKQEIHEKFNQLDPKTHPDLFEFSVLAGKFLEEHERPTFIKLSVFRKYIPLFAPDPKRAKEDPDYQAALTRLFAEYTRTVINPCYPVIITDDRTGEIVGIHNRMRPRIDSAGMDVKTLSNRERLANPPPTDRHAEFATISSGNDFLLANNTKEFRDRVVQWKLESIIIDYAKKHLSKKQNVTDTPSTDTSEQSPETPKEPARRPTRTTFI